MFFLALNLRHKHVLENPTTPSLIHPLVVSVQQNRLNGRTDPRGVLVLSNLLLQILYVRSEVNATSGAAPLSSRTGAPVVTTPDQSITISQLSITIFPTHLQ